jgi:hypothetical protein
MDAEKKTCDKCGITKPYFGFASLRSKPGTRKTTCKACIREMNGERSEAEKQRWIDSQVRDLNGSDY